MTQATSLGTLVAIFVFLCSIPFASAATCPNLTRNLSFGSRGSDVTSLQTYLIAEGDLAAGNNTGYFGRLTEAAVKAFQRRNNVVSSGSAATTGYGAVGSKTRAALVACASVAPTPPTSSASLILNRNLSRGSEGSDVRALQQFLITQGLLAADSATGFFGALTESAVKKWQSQNGITSSGTSATTGYGAVGPKTRAAIMRAAAGTFPQTPLSTPPSTIPITFDPLPPRPSQQPSELAQCPVVPLPVGQTCAGTLEEVKDTQGICTASWRCVTH